MSKQSEKSEQNHPNDHMMASIEGLWDTANATMQADLKKRVKKTPKKPDDAPITASGTASSGTPSTDDAISRLKDMSQLRSPTAPPDAAASDDPPLAAEAMFSDAFTKLVQQIVENYLDKNLAPIVRKAAQAELKKKPKTPRKTSKTRRKT